MWRHFYSEIPHKAKRMQVTFCLNYLYKLLRIFFSLLLSYKFHFMRKLFPRIVGRPEHGIVPNSKLLHIGKLGSEHWIRCKTLCLFVQHKYGHLISNYGSNQVNVNINLQIISFVCSLYFFLSVSITFTMVMCVWVWIVFLLHAVDSNWYQKYQMSKLWK